MNEMNDVIDEIRGVERGGKYRNFAHDPIEVATIAGHSFLYFEGSLEEFGNKVWTATLMTVRDGVLLKFRMSERLATHSPSKRAFFAFVGEVISKN
jgi:hypothetical protein